MAHCYSVEDKVEVQLGVEDFEVIRSGEDYRGSFYPVQIEEFIPADDQPVPLRTPYMSPDAPKRDMYMLHYLKPGPHGYQLTNQIEMVSPLCILRPPPTRRHNLIKRLAKRGGLVEVFMRGGFWLAKVLRFIIPKDGLTPYYELELIVTKKRVKASIAVVRRHVPSYRRTAAVPVLPPELLPR